MPRLLELYSGTGSMGKAFRKLGWKVVSVDLRADFNPDICCDVLDFDVGMLEGKPVDVVWASPLVHSTLVLGPELKHRGIL